MKGERAINYAKHIKKYGQKPISWLLAPRRFGFVLRDGPGFVQI